MSTIARNKALLKSVLVDNLSYSECAKKYQMNTVGGIQAAVRSMLEILKEHTDIEVEPTGSYEYVIQHKQDLLHYLEKPFPKVKIAPAARAYLQKKYGKYYASIPETIVQDWEELKKVFNEYHHARERYSLLAWFASEGHLVGDFVDQDMLDMAYGAMINALQTVDVQKGALGFKVTATRVDRTSDNRADVLFDAELTADSYVARRRFKISLL